MKKIAVLLTMFLLLLGTNVHARKGHYKGGRGSSHKGGHYKNTSTHDHYKKRR